MKESTKSSTSIPILLRKLEANASLYNSTRKGHDLICWFAQEEAKQEVER